jgi:hypothetical protein
MNTNMRTFYIYYNGALQGLSKAPSPEDAIAKFKKAQESFLSIPFNSPIYDGIKAT